MLHSGAPHHRIRPERKVRQGVWRPADGYEWPTTEHGVYADHKGNIWVAGNGKGDNQILKFTNTGKFLLQIGKRNQSKGSNDTANVYGAASMVVYPKTNELFVADGYTNRRVIVYDADTGAYKRHWGAYGKPPDDSYKFPERAQLIVGPPSPSFGNPVHSVVVSNDDMVYVGDRSNNRIQVFRSTEPSSPKSSSTGTRSRTKAPSTTSRCRAIRSSDICSSPTAATRRCSSSIAGRSRCCRHLAGRAGTTRGSSSTCTACRRSPIRRGTSISARSTRGSATSGCGIRDSASLRIPAIRRCQRRHSDQVTSTSHKSRTRLRFGSS